MNPKKPEIIEKNDKDHKKLEDMIWAIKAIDASYDGFHTYEQSEEFLNELDT